MVKSSVCGHDVVCLRYYTWNPFLFFNRMWIIDDSIGTVSAVLCLKIYSIYVYIPIEKLCNIEKWNILILKDAVIDELLRFTVWFMMFITRKNLWYLKHYYFCLQSLRISFSSDEKLSRSKSQIMNLLEANAFAALL